jgi:hypothetical protein
MPDVVRVEQVGHHKFTRIVRGQIGEVGVEAPRDAGALERGLPSVGGRYRVVLECIEEIVAARKAPIDRIG